jgi:hypothetical protein
LEGTATVAATIAVEANSDKQKQTMTSSNNDDKRNVGNSQPRQESRVIFGIISRSLRLINKQQIYCIE